MPTTTAPSSKDEKRAKRTLPLVMGCCTPILAEPFDAEAADQLAQAFAALADPVRLRILNLVAASGELCSCDLLGPLGKAQPTISHHTKALAEAGLLAAEKRGKWTWWRVVPEQLAALRSALDPPSS
jgi:ArsR family transcriptional regulator